MTWRRSIGLLAVTALLVALDTQVTGFAVGLLHLLPALGLALPLAWGRYVGEERIAKLATAAARRGRLPRARGAWTARGPRAPRVARSRAGALIAASLAERGPPAQPVAAR
jgi:hypothetical protein